MYRYIKYKVFDWIINNVINIFDCVCFYEMKDVVVFLNIYFLR